mmetsp:Transcript_90106/g.160471  ORF Transcript_90106/g.160471 Transcript_90106/m.160471 type:complete len:158 (+) Transcript_90106:48-521(+)
MGVGKVAPDEDEFAQGVPAKADDETSELPMWRTEQTKCFCIYDNEQDPRCCVWKRFSAHPSPNIATHTGKAILGLVGGATLAGFIVAVTFLVRMGGVPGLVERIRPNETEDDGRRMMAGWNDFDDVAWEYSEADFGDDSVLPDVAVSARSVSELARQ